MYRVDKIIIHKDSELFEWCDTITKKANNLYNATLFVMRQTMTGLSKEEKERTQNENDVLSNVFAVAKEHEMLVPTKEKFFLSYKFLDKYMRFTNNPDYFSEGLPMQSAQAEAKLVTKAMKGYFSSLKSYKAHPENFTGKPELPGYHRKGRNSTVTLTNQDCVVFLDKDTNKYFVKLPLTKYRCGINVPVGKLKEAKVTPYYNSFIISLIFDDGKTNASPVSKSPMRIAAMDMGVDNFVSLTTNTNNKGLIINGKPLKAINQLYNKRIAAIKSEQTKGGTDKFVPTEESIALDYKRDVQINDFMHKSASLVLKWLKSHNIDTFVYGHNKFWKQETKMSKTNNQNFVQLPFAKFAGILKYLCEREGIQFIEQEESYTSKASFLDNDPIPVYEEGSTAKHAFSGHRRPTHYKGMHKKDGFRGLYVSKDGRIINSDLNGSANIGRKAFPELYTTVCFDKPEIIKHPDLVYKNPNAVKKNTISVSKMRRLKRKNKSIPIGIGLCE